MSPTPAPIRVGLALMAEADHRQAVLPLFAEGLVEVLEWSPDTMWRAIPDWAQALLAHYAAEDRLYAHGVSFSPLSGAWEPRQQAWLSWLAREQDRFPARLLSEHFGFCSTPGWRRTPPLPVPFSREALAIGRDRLARLSDVVGVAVGLENLALALSERDVLEQGPFLEALLEPSGGFLLLDLHNLYCQAHNFGRDPLELLERLPLARARVLHLSGGSWSSPASGGPAIRRDTHDNAIPAEVLALLPAALERCPSLEAVIVERLGGERGRLTPAEAAELQSQFRAVRQVVAGHGQTVAAAALDRASLTELPPDPPEAESLARYQQALCDRLANHEPLRPDDESLAPFAAAVAAAEPRMIEVARELMARWGVRNRS